MGYILRCSFCNFRKFEGIINPDTRDLILFQDTSVSLLHAATGDIEWHTAKYSTFSMFYFIQPQSRLHDSSKRCYIFSILRRICHCHKY